jgi:hypothetical protein
VLLRKNERIAGYIYVVPNVYAFASIQKRIIAYYRMMTDMHAGWLKEAASPIYYAIFWNVYAKNITVQRVTNRM